MPASFADPSAVAEFSKIMQKGLNQESNPGRVTGGQTPDAFPGPDRLQGHQSLNGPVSVTPMTLGERLAADRIDQTKNPSTKEWLDTVTDIFEKDTISFPDLYRVQVLAGMAQIETTRNSSVSKSMDGGLKTLLKNT